MVSSAKSPSSGAKSGAKRHCSPTTVNAQHSIAVIAKYYNRANIRGCVSDSFILSKKRGIFEKIDKTFIDSDASKDASKDDIVPAA